MKQPRLAIEAVLLLYVRRIGGSELSDLGRRSHAREEDGGFDAGFGEEWGSRTRSILLRIESKAGHGAEKPVTKQIEEFTNVYAFLFWQLGVRE